MRGDYATSVRFLKQLAELGDAHAQGELGAAYGTGRGVPRDDVLASMWFSLAAAGGNSTAGGLRDICLTNMTPDQIAEAQRLSREWKPK